MAAALPSPVDARDHIAESFFRAHTAPALPQEYDLRADLNPIRNQGATSTCAAQTAACIKEWQERHDGGVLADLSEQFVYNFRMNAPAEGMYGRDVMRILMKKGICLEKDFPKSRKEPCADEEILARARKLRIEEYAQVLTIAGLKEALVRSGPCYISFPLYNHSSEFWMQESEDQRAKGGHACAVVGYNADGFIIRNSWGRAWGDYGYGTYPYGHFGAHYEIWSCIDRKGSLALPPAPPQERPSCSETLALCIRRLFR